MKVKSYVGVGLGISLVLLLTVVALAKSSYLNDFNNVYSTENTRLDSCDHCHPGGRTSRLDAYGDDMMVEHKKGLSWRESIIAIESFDSDGDGWTNLEEINALTFPGDANDKPNGTPSPTPTPTSIPSPTATPPDPTPTEEMQTFTDVPLDHWAFSHIDALYNGGYVAGCSSAPLMYCPDSPMTRAESAVFVERGIWGAGYLPPQPTQQIFADVLLTEWYGKWAEGLWNDGFTSGCATMPLVYCPLMQHSIAEGTVFYLRMMHGVNYVPPEPAGIFEDVPVDAWYAKWVEEAYHAGLVIPCETSPALRACPQDPLTRALGAFMMVEAKGIPIK